MGLHITTHKGVKLRQPKDIDVKIWRYMSLKKLIDFLRTNELYFARGEILKDKFEGTGTRANIQKRDLLAKHLTQQNKGWSIDRGESAVKNILSVKKKLVYMNCWHKNDKESVAMWNMYGETDEAVVIQSTYEKLKRQLDPDYYTKDGRKVIDPERMAREAGGQMSFERECYYLGEVSYIDYETDPAISEGDLVTQFMHKRKEYEYEQEIRAFTVHMAGNYHQIQGYKVVDESVRGVRKKVNVQDLVESIRLRMGTEESIRDMIKDTCKKYNKEIRIEYSELDQNPLL